MLPERKKDTEMKGQTVNTSRMAYIDNLRALMIIFVVMVHTGVTYSGLGSWYYIRKARHRSGFNVRVRDASVVDPGVFHGLALSDRRLFHACFIGQGWETSIGTD
jgi:hypothetical protein